MRFLWCSLLDCLDWLSVKSVFTWLSFLRWHHIESLLKGGETITVNFWYKVSKFSYSVVVVTDSIPKWHFLHLYFVSPGCTHPQEDRISPESPSEGSHHEKHWEDARGSTWKPTWGNSRDDGLYSFFKLKSLVLGCELLHFVIVLTAKFGRECHAATF